ncbi:MAG: hypothetical protein K0R25_775 [Rickettsiaceae bacterium]|jgi:hypothetical protein|nr:hypothetical protein [Rickettsiaceae bacterium]
MSRNDKGLLSRLANNLKPGRGEMGAGGAAMGEEVTEDILQPAKSRSSSFGGQPTFSRTGTGSSLSGLSQSDSAVFPPEEEGKERDILSGSKSKIERRFSQILPPKQSSVAPRRASEGEKPNKAGRKMSGGGSGRNLLDRLRRKKSEENKNEEQPMYKELPPEIYETDLYPLSQEEKLSLAKINKDYITDVVFIVDQLKYDEDLKYFQETEELITVSDDYKNKSFGGEYSKGQEEGAIVLVGVAEAFLFKILQTELRGNEKIKKLQKVQKTIVEEVNKIWGKNSLPPEVHKAMYEDWVSFNSLDPNNKALSQVAGEVRSPSHSLRDPNAEPVVVAAQQGRE